MENTHVEKTTIEGLLKISRPVFPDERGFFHEVVRMNDLESVLGFNFNPVQISHSLSIPKVIRAIHTEGWNKLIYPVTGKLFVVIVDLRPESKTFLSKEEFTFDNTKNDSTHFALFLPKGVGNSLCVIGDDPVNYIYAVDEYWDNSKAKGIAWNDPDIAIDWPIKDPIISERDQNNQSLRSLFPDKFK